MLTVIISDEEELIRGRIFSFDPGMDSLDGAISYPTGSNTTA